MEYAVNGALNVYIKSDLGIRRSSLESNSPKVDSKNDPKYETPNKNTANHSNIPFFSSNPSETNTNNNGSPNSHGNTSPNGNNQNISNHSNPNNTYSNYNYSNIPRITKYGSGNFPSIYNSPSSNTNVNPTNSNAGPNSNSNNSSNDIPNNNSNIMNNPNLNLPSINIPNNIHSTNNANFQYNDFIRRLFVQIVTAIDYLHNVKHIIHRDIKPQNILIDRYNKIKIADFGFSTLEDSMTNTRCGSPGYASPEILLKQEYNASTDIWSMGVVLYAMASGGNLPFADTNVQAVCKKIINDPVRIPKGMDPLLSDLISQMLEKNPARRITMEKIKMHEWLQYDDIIAEMQLADATNRINNEQINRRVMAKLNSIGFTNDVVNLRIEKSDKEMIADVNILRWKYEGEKMRKISITPRSQSKTLETGRLFIGLGSKVKCYRRRENI